MKISSSLFEAFLKCPTKCWLHANNETSSGNDYAEWVKSYNASFRATQTQRLQSEIRKEEYAISPPAEGVKTARWCLAMSMVAEAETNSCAAESELHAVERVPSEGRGRPARFIPIRFIFRNKLSKDDKLLLAFDAFVLAQALGREISIGKIIHGDNHATLKVKTSALAGEVSKLLEKSAALLANEKPPDLVLNRHCPECEFRDRCRQKAIEADDLSLLAGMSAKERQKFRSKGIFTVTQLSYTFRPRRRPKRLRDKREKHHHSLKALAIRDQKIHIVGSPELKIEGTPVYLDVEGLPDRGFYYLIGLRVGDGDSAVQHSLWADTVEDEGKIWREFLTTLATIEAPVLIHYGSYETTFLNQMRGRHGEAPEGSEAAKTLESAVNLLSHIFAQIYYPTYSNGLKVAGWFGFRWKEDKASGLQSILWRLGWEECASSALRARLVNYNAADCHASEVLTHVLHTLGHSEAPEDPMKSWRDSAVHVESIQRRMPWRRFTSPVSEFEAINKAARWAYQSYRAHVRDAKRVRRVGRPKNSEACRDRVNQVIVCEPETHCPKCHKVACQQIVVRRQIVRDIRFGAGAIKRWIVEYRFRYCWCSTCRRRFGGPSGLLNVMKYGWNFIAYLLYQVIALRIPQSVVRSSVERLLGIQINLSATAKLKAAAAEYYRDTQATILRKIADGGLVHVDETKANIRGKMGYVWVFTNLREVAYLYSDSREGELAHATLSGFKGVLVSDFFSAYDSFLCPQQKCLIHLMRDMNDAILSRPFDEELRRIVMGFAGILKPMIETVDRYGLRKHFLKRHRKKVERFYREIRQADFSSEAAIAWKERFNKNHDKLFTFLEHDGVPWNNNNAEHAVKAFALLRDVIRGSSTQKGLEDYLTLLSICETCKYMGVDFLDFLRSGEKDIHAFAKSRRRRKHRSGLCRSDPVKPSAASLTGSNPAGS